MSKNNQQNWLSIISVAMVVVISLGVSFAFFNYTRIGDANNGNGGYVHVLQTATPCRVTSNGALLCIASAPSAPGN